MHVFVILLAYFFALLLLAGAFYCMYMGAKLLHRRSKAASAKTDFSGKFGGMEFTIGAGSIAALTMALSAVWVAAALLARPKVEFSSDPGHGVGVIRLISDVKVRNPAESVQAVPVDIPRPLPSDHNGMPPQRYAYGSADLEGTKAAAAAAAAAAIAAEAAAAVVREGEDRALRAAMDKPPRSWRRPQKPSCRRSFSRPRIRQRSGHPRLHRNPNRIINP